MYDINFYKDFKTVFANNRPVSLLLLIDRFKETIIKNKVTGHVCNCDMMEKELILWYHKPPLIP